MLQLILGRAGSGKTYRIREQVKQLAEQNTEKIMLLVPEQYSFESEKAMLKLLGPKQVNKVQVMSFTRLTDMAFRSYGGSGIGLSIVKAIMDSMHQQCGVINHEDGVEFWIELDTSNRDDNEEECEITIA